MASAKKQWYVLPDDATELDGPFTRDELDGLFREEKIHEYTECFTRQMLRRPRGPAGIMRGIPYSMLARNDIELCPTPEEFHESRSGRPTTVLSGPNNGGKTFFLKNLFYHVGHEGFLVACNRFSQIDILNSRKREEHEHIQRYDNFAFNFQSAQHNSEDNELKLDQILTGMKDKQRDKLFATAGELLGNRFTMEPTDPDNKFSPFYVKMDDQSLSYGSSGTRLLLTILGILLDDRFTTILIDEPEIGLSPRIQSRLARFLYDPDERAAFCPHVRNLYVATHSHLFLDKKNHTNNHIVSKEGKVITIEEVATPSALHHLQFNMLGNDLDSVFMPEAIIIVEGDSDATFLNKVVELYIPDRRISIVSSGGEGGMEMRVHFFTQAFGKLKSSIYRDRFCIVLDQKISIRPGQLEKQGVLPENITQWAKNGIEYYYPPDLVAAAFCCDPSEVSQIPFEKDKNNIEFRETIHTKNTLAEMVAAKLSKKHTLDPELDKLVQRLKAICE